MNYFWAFVTGGAILRWWASSFLDLTALTPARIP